MVSQSISTTIETSDALLEGKQKATFRDLRFEIDERNELKCIVRRVIEPPWPAEKAVQATPDEACFGGHSWVAAPRLPDCSDGHPCQSSEQNEHLREQLKRILQQKAEAAARQQQEATMRRRAKALAELPRVLQL
eukprot:TRINITY_DN42154_c0_g1_i1.p2 TRINITY_DN42154_c0_g1~~TRINITY_DN42154_c0_g1_i1.p2  ORF type:complete len:135 (-),score=33.74 TRINITY_DN42154_c0_g1_i1:220-624(-)